VKNNRNIVVTTYTFTTTSRIIGTSNEIRLGRVVFVDLLNTLRRRRPVPEEDRIEEARIELYLTESRELRFTVVSCLGRTV
jgi:hypothetical protein